MSRLKRLKQRKRKNIIKATVCGLALSLSMRSLQVLETYALFRDVEKIYNNLAISTGDVDVEVGEGFKKIKLEKGKEYTKEFNISNKGTLRQKVYLRFNYKGSESPEGMTYKLKISHNGKFLGEIIKSGEELKSSEEIEIKDNNSDFILEPGENITCNASIKLDHTENIDAKENGNLNFDLKITSKQIGFKNSGFFDIESQENKIYVSDEDQFETVWGNCQCCKNPAIIFDYPEEFKEKEIDLRIFGEDEFTGFSAHYNYRDGKIYLVKLNQVDYPLKEEDILREKGFKVDFVIDSGRYQRYLLTFKKINGKIIGKWTKGEIIG